MKIDFLSGQNEEPEKERKKDCNEGIKRTRTTTKANRKLNRKETTDVPERRNVREHRKSARDRKTDSKRQRWKAQKKSRKSQKGGNEHNQSKNIECNAESKATEQPKLTTETAEQEQRRAKVGRPKTAENKKQLIGTHSLFGGRKSFGK
jgi:hypothetical protein